MSDTLDLLNHSNPENKVKWNIERNHHEHFTYSFYKDIHFFEDNDTIKVEVTFINNDEYPLIGIEREYDSEYDSTDGRINTTMRSDEFRFINDECKKLIKFLSDKKKKLE